MSETVLWLWYCARHAQRRHWYALAARYYRLCDMVYQCADDLGPFDQECYNCGNAADGQMRRMLSKLPKEEADEILEEAHDYHASRAAGGTYFFFDWPLGACGPCGRNIQACGDEFGCGCRAGRCYRARRIPPESQKQDFDQKQPDRCNPDA